MYLELYRKLKEVIERTDVEGLRLLAWQELKRDGVLQGTKDDIGLMMNEMRDIMRIRFEQAVKESVGSVTLREIRKKCAENLQSWMSQKWANEYVSKTAEELEYMDLGVAG